MTKRFTQAEKDEIMDRYYAGEMLSNIAASYNVPRAKIDSMINWRRKTHQLPKRYGQPERQFGSLRFQFRGCSVEVADYINMNCPPDKTIAEFLVDILKEKAGA